MSISASRCWKFSFSADWKRLQLSVCTLECLTLSAGLSPQKVSETRWDERPQTQVSKDHKGDVRRRESTMLRDVSIGGKHRIFFSVLYSDINDSPTFKDSMGDRPASSHGFYERVAAPDDGTGAVCNLRRNTRSCGLARIASSLGDPLSSRKVRTIPRDVSIGGSCRIFFYVFVRHQRQH